MLWIGVGARVCKTRIGLRKAKIRSTLHIIHRPAVGAVGGQREWEEVIAPWQSKLHNGVPRSAPSASRYLQFAHSISHLPLRKMAMCRILCWTKRGLFNKGRSSCVTSYFFLMLTCRQEITSWSFQCYMRPIHYHLYECVLSLFSYNLRTSVSLVSILLWVYICVPKMWPESFIQSIDCESHRKKKDVTLV